MNEDPHIPVLIGPLVDAVTPVAGVWIDGTFGAGGYARALMAAGASRVIGIDRDPDVLAAAGRWADEFDGRVTLHGGCYSQMVEIAAGAGAPQVDGVVLDIGVSSMQIDQASRGFSFMSDGPLDMRMAQSGRSAADIVNTAAEAEIADILFRYGEERASRRIARNMVRARDEADITTTGALAKIIEQSLPRPKPGQPHPATRSFQALRIAVNDELGELARGLSAAETVLKPGGHLAVVSFHSLEDRMVKRFMQIRSGNAPRANRFAPEEHKDEARFALVTRKAVAADDHEVAANPRARSAKLRVAKRTDAPAGEIDASAIGLPHVAPRHGGRL